MLQSRLEQLTPTGPVLPASLAAVNKRCGQPSCACHHGGSLHQAHHLTLKEKGKTRTVYVPQDLLDEVRQWVAEHQRLKTVLTSWPAPSPQEGASLNIAPILARTIRHKTLEYFWRGTPSAHPTTPPPLDFSGLGACSLRVQAAFDVLNCPGRRLEGP
jgi:hypothetical protein